MKIRLLVFLLFPALLAQAQIWNGSDTLYGNEWIDFSKTYFKIRVATDGIYRVPQQALQNAGFPVSSAPASGFRLYRYGQQEPIFTSTEGIFSSTDFFEFFGERNRDALDRHLFENPDAENLNPWYSLINDTSAYYLVWEPNTPALRYSAVPNDLSNPPAPEPFCWFSTGYAYSNYLFKRQISDEITYSWFNGDGFATYPEPDFSANIVPRKLMPGGPDATLNVRYGCGLGQHQQQVSLNDSLLASDAFTGFGIRQHALSVPTAQLVVNNKVRFKSALGGNDRNAVAGIFLRYPRLLDFENASSAEFFLDGSSTAKYLEVQAFNAAGGAPVLYDLGRRFRLETLVQNNLVKVLLPAASSAQRLWLSSVGAGITVVTSLSPVQFRDYRPEAADYIILSNAALYQDPEHNGANQVEAYAAYRRSPEGGGYKVTVVDVNELYDQFGYGVRFHPLALRNFLQYAEQQWPDPRYLLIIGKGLEYAGFRNPNTQKLLADSLFFVPTYGAPGADQLLVMAQKKLSAPLLSVGRLAVTKPSEILHYLEKVKEHEQAYLSAPQTLEGKAWMKRVIHNSGGLSGEQAGIRTYVESMATELAQNRVGADIYTYYKTSNDPIQLSSYEQMLQLIDGGVSMWMIYGHSSPNAVDFDIGAPNAYHNKGRYPLMMIMGCFSGQCSLPQKGIGEQFVLAPERGAIAYFASVNFSFIEALHTFGKQYYRQLGGADYGRSIGEVLSHTVAELQPTNYSALAALLHQSLLQGDPAVHLHHYPGPDYVIDPQTLRFDPNPVSVEQAKLHLDVDVVNLGEHTADTLALRVVQRRPDGAELQRLLDTIPGPAFRQPLSRLLPTAGSQLGFNRFLLSLDPQNAVAEQPLAAEFNNELTDANGQTGVDLYFFADDVAPIAPEDFGIVRQPTVTLRASTLNFNAAPARYLFELDTLEQFNSPFRMAAQVLQRGGLLEWKVPKDLEDNKVYYWRVARDSLVNGQVPWRVRSFICRNSSPAGWNQSHFGQFAQDVFVNLEALGTSRRLEFVNSTGLASLNVAYRNIDRYPGMQNAYYEGFFGDAGLNGQGFQRGVLLMVQNPNTGHLIPNLPGSPYNSSSKAKPFFAFDTRDSLGRRALMDFIDQEIPTDYVVGLLAFQPYNDTVGYAPRRWARDSIAFGKNLFQVLEAQGAREVRQLVQYNPVPHPYGLIFRKDNPGFDAIDTTVVHIDSMINIRRSFLAKWSVGQFETPAIGPARHWSSLHWQHGPTDDPSDQQFLSVIGVREGQPDTLLLALQQIFDTSLAHIPATEFPFLKLRYESGDTLTRSATQPLHLRLLYEPVPEGALHPLARYAFHADTLQQGESGRVSLAFANVSESGFDSLLVKFRVENESSAGQEYLRKFRPLPAGDTLHATLEFDTRQISGKQRLLVDVNPAVDQPEMTHFNNTALREFFVSRDQRNPLLEVTFDGQHLLDGDIVSPVPVIVVTLKDENRYLALSDTGSFQLRLRLPDGSMQALSLQDPSVMFFPADAGNLPKKNLARLEWRPTFTLDGDYQLFINGRDASGNVSGALDYAVTFRIITKSSISNLLNYPNPFSSSTCFFYTLTGAVAPEHFRMRILTVSGRVVREITEQEFGPMQAGTHRSQFCWDGRDQFGDLLANGVYLYQIVAKKADGSNFEFFENTQIDGYFKNGFGKMVLMR